MITTVQTNTIARVNAYAYNNLFAHLFKNIAIHTTMLAILLCCVLGSNLSWAAAKPISKNDQDKRFIEYTDLLKKYHRELGPFGSAAKYEIEIILDHDKMKEIESRTGRIVGVILDDPYWLLLNDSVKFPNGKTGVYGRVLWKKSLGNKICGVAVLIMTADGKIVLNRNYRHATRSWEYELPRGGVEKSESIESAAFREIQEETGFLIKDLKPLGEMATDSGATNSIVSVFLATVNRHASSAPEDSEAIAAVETFSIEDVRNGLVAGYLVHHEKGQEIKIPFRDPFLTFALWQAEARGLLKK